MFFESIRGAELSISVVAYCALVALGVGICFALSFMLKNKYTKSFITTLVVLPVVVSLAVMFLSSLTTTLAVAGVFTLVRFRSMQGSAKEISFLFSSIIAGVLSGLGYLGYAFVITLALCAILIGLAFIPIGDQKNGSRLLTITIPEDVDYTSEFTDIFHTYCKKCEMVRVKLTGMGSLYEVRFEIELKSVKDEKKMIDELRIRNGNLTIVCARPLREEAL